MKNKLIKKLLGWSLVASVMQFFYAQLVVWGLSLFHVNSGIWGTWLIMEGAGDLLLVSVWLGTTRTFHTAMED